MMSYQEKNQNVCSFGTFNIRVFMVPLNVYNSFEHIQESFFASVFLQLKVLKGNGYGNILSCYIIMQLGIVSGVLAYDFPYFCRYNATLILLLQSPFHTDVSNLSALPY